MKKTVRTMSAKTGPGNVGAIFQEMMDLIRDNDVLDLTVRYRRKPSLKRWKAKRPLRQFVVKMEQRPTVTIRRVHLRRVNRAGGR